MKYYSLNNKKHQVSFKEAVINGLAPDKGLYFPESLHQLSDDHFLKILKIYLMKKLLFK